MFETSEQNGWLIAEYAQTSSYSVASSIMGDVKKLKSNDTDMSVSNALGRSGLNFAYVDGWISYHNATDNLENVDSNSVFHHSLQMYEMAKRFSQIDLTHTSDENRIYLTLFGQVIHYSKTWSLGLSVMVLIVTGVLLLCGLKKRWMTPKGLLLGIGMIVLSAVLSIAATYGAWLIVKELWADQMINDTDAVYQGGLYHLAFILLTAAITMPLYTVLSRRAAIIEFAGSLLTVSGILLVLLSIFAPGGAYLLTWPMMWGTLGLGLDSDIHGK